MKKIVIFGAAKVGLQVKKQLESEGNQVIAFSDNDSSRWGDLFDGIKIVEPHKISSTCSFDVIAIGNFKAAQVIKKQLLEYGIDENKIIIPIQPARIFPNVHYKKEESIIKNIMIVYGKALECDDANEVKFESIFQIDFQNNYWALFTFVKQYLDYGMNVWKSYTEKEQEILCKIDGLTLTVIVEPEKNKIEQIQKQVLKKGLYAFSVESQWLEKNIRSSADCLFWKYRFPRGFDERLLKKINELKVEMIKNNISEDEFCVVGSTLLQVYGITETEEKDDVDIILTNELRNLYGETLVIVSEHVEIHVKDQYDITDDEIVKNPNCHFWCFGIKFMNLDIFYRNRKRKGISDTKLIEYFFQNQMNEGRV